MFFKNAKQRVFFYYYYFAHLGPVLLWEYYLYWAKNVSGHHRFTSFAPIPYLFQFHTILCEKSVNPHTVNWNGQASKPGPDPEIHNSHPLRRRKILKKNLHGKEIFVFEVDTRLLQFNREQIKAERGKKRSVTKNDRAERMSQQL